MISCSSVGGAPAMRLSVCLGWFGFVKCVFFSRWIWPNYNVFVVQVFFFRKGLHMWYTNSKPQSCSLKRLGSFSQKPRKRISQQPQIKAWLKAWKRKHHQKFNPKIYESFLKTWPEDDLRKVNEIIKGSLEDTSELRRVEERCDWKGEGSRGDVN